jgi:hypothetical protein
MEGKTMTTEATIIVYLSDDRRVILPDCRVDPNETLYYEATRGFSHSLAAFDRATGTPVGYVLVSELGFDSAAKWLEVDNQRKLLEIIRKLADTNMAYVNRNPDYRFTCIFDIRRESKLQGIPKFEGPLEKLLGQGKVKRENGDGIRTYATMYSVSEGEIL